MSDEHGSVRLPKWPFYLADLLLSGIALFVLYRLGTFEGTGEMVLVGGCLAVAVVAAWISIVPWLREHETRAQLGESSNLKSSIEQIKGLDKIADLIRQSNAQWQGIQDASSRTVSSAREITERMKAEADEFMKFLSNAHEQERAGLRLEVEKLRRMEGDWVRVSVQMLDHVYALFHAAERSGQQNLITQLTQFQNACRDVARRMGLSSFTPEGGEPFDARAHQLIDPNAAPAEGARIAEALAPGFTYQGQLLRRSLVRVADADPVEPVASRTEPAESGPLEEQQSPGMEMEALGEPAEMSPGEDAPSPETGPEEEPRVASDEEFFETIEQPVEPVEPVESAEPVEADVLTEAPSEPQVQTPTRKAPAGRQSPQEELPF